MLLPGNWLLCAETGRSSDERHRWGTPSGDYPPTLTDPPYRQPVVARARQGMIRAGDIGPDEVRK